jgi:hypothetical protein
MKKHCQFVNKCPSDEWVTDFMSRHHLSLRLPSMQEKVRKEAASDPFFIFEFYNILKNELDNLGILKKTSHIFNCDESAFFVDPVRGRIVSELSQFFIQPFLLVFDGHRTHISLDLIKCAKDNNVSLLKLAVSIYPSLQLNLRSTREQSVCCYNELKGA